MLPVVQRRRPRQPSTLLPARPGPARRPGRRQDRRGAPRLGERLARRLALSCYRFVVVHPEDRSILDASLYELKEATVVGAADLPPHTAASVYDVEQLPVARAVVTSSETSEPKIRPPALA